jgi:5'-nucleotidase
MAQGYDGFTAMKGRKFIIDDENGQIMSSIIRSFLLGKLADACRTKLISRLILHLPT